MSPTASKLRAVWVSHPHSGVTVPILCENNRKAISLQVRIAVARMGVPRSECAVRFAKSR